MPPRNGGWSCWVASKGGGDVEARIGDRDVRRETAIGMLGCETRVLLISLEVSVVSFGSREAAIGRSHGVSHGIGSSRYESPEGTTGRRAAAFLSSLRDFRSRWLAVIHGLTPMARIWRPFGTGHSNKSRRSTPLPRSNVGQCSPQDKGGYVGVRNEVLLISFEVSVVSFREPRSGGRQ